LVGWMMGVRRAPRESGTGIVRKEQGKLEESEYVSVYGEDGNGNWRYGEGDRGAEGISGE